MTSRFGAIAMIFGGALIAGSGVAMNAAPVAASLGYKDTSGAVFALIAGIVAVGASAYQRASRQTRVSLARRLAAAGIVAGGLVALAPWPVMALGFFLFVGSTAAYGVTMFIERPGILAAFLAISGLAMLAVNTEDARALLSVPHGLAWIAYGVSDLMARQAVGDPISPSG